MWKTLTLKWLTTKTAIETRKQKTRKRGCIFPPVQLSWPKTGSIGWVIMLITKSNLILNGGPKQCCEYIVRRRKVKFPKHLAKSKFWIFVKPTLISIQSKFQHCVAFRLLDKCLECFNMRLRVQSVLTSAIWKIPNTKHNTGNYINDCYAIEHIWDLTPLTPKL